MKTILLTLLITIPGFLFGQCTKCTSFEEALIKPEMVETIQINSGMHGIILDTIPSYIDTFVNLKRLFLTEHNIESLPTNLKSLKKLKELSFAQCKLKSLPNFIFEMKNLKELILFYNEFPKETKAEIIAKLKKELPNTKILLDEE